MSLQFLRHPARFERCPRCCLDEFVVIECLPFPEFVALVAVSSGTEDALKVLCSPAMACPRER